MDLKESLLAKYSKNQMEQIADWIGHDAGRFDQLIRIMLEGDDRPSRQAAWALSHAVDRHPQLIQPHLRALVHQLDEEQQHPAIRRNILRALQWTELPEDLWGIAADHCFRFLADPRQPAAIRVFSMSILWNLCRQVPELQSELKLIIEDQWEYASAGFRSRGKKILKQMNKAGA